MTVGTTIEFMKGLSKISKDLHESKQIENKLSDHITTILKPKHRK
jgi:hypothetical protein